MPERIVNLSWDSEAAVWIATSDDIPGLILESGSYDALVERVRYAVTDLIKEANIPLFFKSERHERAYG
ncbi:MAG: DUF1902 domain-containing protein [Oscillospiraceae bacterium]|nr:DUF1902 domain-containing protein [Oscillospiraceae bacterium]